jgi:hypothetical protein
LDLALRHSRSTNSLSHQAIAIMLMAIPFSVSTPVNAGAGELAALVRVGSPDLRAAMASRIWEQRGGALHCSGAQAADL